MRALRFAREMKKPSIIFALILLFACGQTAKIYPQAKTFSLTKEQWRKDLQYLARELPARHENAFHTVTREQFEKAVAELNAAIPYNYSESDELTLPNSRLKVSYSTKYYKFQEKDAPAVMPDKLIEPVWELYTAGRDAALEWILAQPLPG
jgi:hypothetical protein